MRTLSLILLLAGAAMLRADGPASSNLRPDNEGATLLDKSKWSFSSYFISNAPADRRRFETEVSGDQLLKTPLWSTDDDHPPLAPRKAQALALAMLEEIMPGREWFAPEFHLKPFFAMSSGDARNNGKRWVYVLTFEIVPKNSFEGGTFNVVVLMDGTVVWPKYITDSGVATQLKPKDT